MRILSHQENIQRGCIYCAYVKVEKVEDKNKRACPYDECPYHELDEFATYDEYQKHKKETREHDC